MSAGKTFSAVLVIFLAGLLTGGALVWKFEHRPVEPPADATSTSAFQPWQLKDRYVGYLAKKLDLDAAQVSQISQIVTESQHRTKILLELVEPEMREEMRQVRDTIRALLTEEQQVEFDEIQKRHARRHKEAESKNSDLQRENDPKAPTEHDGSENPTIFNGKCQNGWQLIEDLVLPPTDSCRSG